MTEETAGLDRFGQLKAEIIEQHRLEPNDPHANTLAALKLARERMVEALAAGRTIDFTAFTRILEMLEKHEPPLVPKVEVSFVQGVVGIYKCRHCGEQNDLPEGEYTPKEKQPREPMITRCATCGTKSEVSSDPYPDPKPGDTEPPNAAPAPPAAQSPPDNVVAITDTQRAWNRQHGYTTAPDGGLGRHNAVRRRNPNPLGNVLVESNPMKEAEKGHPSPECFK